MSSVMTFASARTIEIPTDYYMDIAENGMSVPYLLNSPDDMVVWDYPQKPTKYWGGPNVIFSPETSSRWETNSVGFSGGAIVEGGSMTFKDGTRIALTSPMYFDTMEAVTFSNIHNRYYRSTNYVSDRYYCEGSACNTSTLLMTNGGNILFEKNAAGALLSADGDLYKLNVYSRGGAIYQGGSGVNHGTEICQNWGSVTFVDNETLAHSSRGADACGGAIYSSNSHTEISDNEGLVSFSDNRAIASCPESGHATAMGGAIGTFDGLFTSNGNRQGVIFDKNYASASSITAFGKAYGGAIYATHGSIELSNNASEVTFNGNNAVATSSAEGKTADSYGGAVYIDNESSVSSVARDFILSGNSGDITFSENHTTTSGSTAHSYGGAVYIGTRSAFELSGNSGDITFSGNHATASGSTARSYGGAIYVVADSTFTLSGNSGDVTFSGNYASATGSNASARGGAVYATDHLAIQNNGNVSFSGNYETAGDTYRLRSIYMKSTGTEGGLFHLSAAEGNQICFEDSIYIDSTVEGQTVDVVFNGNYTPAEGTPIAQGGDIIFSGYNTERHLNVILTKNLVDRLATDEEVLNSRTNQVYALTQLQGGRLRVEDGAIYKGYGITASADSSSTVRIKNATMDHAGYSLTFEDSTTLELAGNNALCGDTQMKQGSTLTFDITSDNGITEVFGNLTFGEGVNVVLQSGSASPATNNILMYVGDDISGYETVSETLPQSTVLTWVDNLLILNYDSQTFNRFYNGTASYAEQQKTTPAPHHAIRLHNYDSLTFNQVSATTSGAAIHGIVDSIIMLSDNNYLGLKNNESTASGGAIYGASGSQIIMRRNENLEFIGNTTAASGGAIYGADKSVVSITGNNSVLFRENTAAAGGGALYVNPNSELKLNNNKSLVFTGNSATAASGGAIYSNAAQSIELNYNESLSFTSNVAGKGDGGAICGDRSSTSNSTHTISLCNNESVDFTSNEASSKGGAIYAHYGTILTLDENKTLSFNNNTASSGGAVYFYGHSISLNNNNELSFLENTVSDDGGAICLNSVDNTTLSANSSALFSGNSAVFGGAIYANLSTVTLNDNVSLEFSNNIATSSGGAIAIRSSSDFSITGSGTLTFSGNQAGTGGAIYNESAGSNILLSSNKKVTFSENTSTTYGGAIKTYGDGLQLNTNSSVLFSQNEAMYGGAISTDAMTLHRNDSLIFDDNHASSSGGAIYISEKDNLLISENGSVEFTLNTAKYGGAIYTKITGATIELRGNESVLFNKNSTTYTGSPHGGAIYTAGNLNILSNDSVEVSDNTASAVPSSASSSVKVHGGAFYVTGKVNIADNGDVVFRNNRATTTSTSDDSTIYGGAMYATGNVTIANNESVIFEKNVEFHLDTYRLRSLYAGGSGDIISLSASKGKSIEFRDAVYIASGSTVNLNKDYTDAASEVHKQAGDIIFSGKNTETHLNAILTADGANRKATSDEIRNSLTTEVRAMTNLYGGRLCIQDGAIYKGYGITAMADSASTVQVQAATLNHAGYSLTFNSGTTLELIQDNLIRGNVAMGEESTLLFNAVSGMGFTDLFGELQFEAGAEVTFEPGNTTLGTNKVLMYVKDGISGWDNVEQPLPEGASITQVDNLLVLNHDEITFNRYYNGSMTDASRQLQDTRLHNYESLNFNQHSSTAAGGAIWRGINGFVILSDNKDVEFENNSAASYGGAIYSNSNSTIELHNNDSVTFSGNKAATSGGAIFTNGATLKITNNDYVAFNTNSATTGGGLQANSDGSIEIDKNASVSFNQNTATSGGGSAIYANGGTLKITNNGSVEFIGNMAVTSTTTGAIHSTGNVTIANNESVLFEKNTRKRYNEYWLEALWAGGSGKVVSLSAAEGKSIEFRDAVYVASGSTLNLNADFDNGTEGSIRQTGDIIFTGEHTVSNLNNVLAANKVNRTATETEIRNSRTSEMLAVAHLYGGRLRVENGAIYEGRGIIATESSYSTVQVKDAELSHVGYNLEFNDSTALEIVGDCTIRGNINLKAGSLFKLEQAASLSLHETLNADASTLTVNGSALLGSGATLNASLTLADGATLDMEALDSGAVTLNGALTFGGKVTMGDNLFSALQELSRKDEYITLFTGLSDLILPTVASVESSGRVWVGDIFSNLAGDEHYYFNYKADVGSLSVVFIPEPTTATLSLLALAALAARRRRK